MMMLKRPLLFLIFTLFMGISMSGCATWHGLKKDTSRTWDVVTA